MFFRRKKRSILSDPKQVEQMLRHLGMISEQLDQGVVIINKNGVIHFANAEWARMHGYKNSDDVLGKALSQFHTKDQMQQEVRTFSSETKRRGRFRGELAYVRIDGTEFVAQTKMVVLKDRRGRFNGFLVYAMDISEIKRVEEELKANIKTVKILKKQIDQLQYQINERSRTENELQDYCDHLEEYVEDHGGDSHVAEKAIEEESAYVDEENERELSREEGRDKFILPLKTEKLKSISDLAKRLK
jgi:PAS domain S-box-containing protein